MILLKRERMKTTLTNEEKEAFLKYCNIERLEGFVMDLERPDDIYLNIFITKEEWIKKTLAGMEVTYYIPNSEKVVSFEEAWEYIEDDKWDEWDVEGSLQGYELFDSQVRLILKETQDE